MSKYTRFIIGVSIMPVMLGIATNIVYIMATYPTMGLIGILTTFSVIIGFCMVEMLDE